MGRRLGGFGRGLFRSSFALPDFPTPPPSPSAHRIREISSSKLLAGVPSLHPTTPIADWPCLALIRLHCFFFLLLFLASALVPLPFPFKAFVQRSEFHSLPKR